MLRKTAVVLITALTFGGAALLTTAYARGTGGGGGGGRDGGGGHGLGAGPHGDEFFVPPGGGGERIGGLSGRNRFAGERWNGNRWNWRHRGNRLGWGPGVEFGFESWPDYGYDCYKNVRYHTRTGWHWRRIYVC